MDYRSVPAIDNLHNNNFFLMWPIHFGDLQETAIVTSVVRLRFSNTEMGFLQACDSICISSV